MNNPLIRKIGATAIAVLLLVYVGYQIYLSQYTGLKTETATYSTVSETIDTTGFIIRDEEIVDTNYNGVLNYTVDDGEKVAAGGVLAETYPTEEDAAAQNRIAQKLLRRLRRRSLSLRRLPRRVAGCRGGSGGQAHH